MERLTSLETLGELSLSKRDDWESQLHTEGKAAIGLMRRVEAGNSEEATDMDNLSSSGGIEEQRLGNHQTKTMYSPI
jgi:hypothetical protein